MLSIIAAVSLSASPCLPLPAYALPTGDQEVGIAGDADDTTTPDGLESGGNADAGSQTGTGEQTGSGGEDDGSGGEDDFISSSPARVAPAGSGQDGGLEEVEPNEITDESVDIQLKVKNPAGLTGSGKSGSGSSESTIQGSLFEDITSSAATALKEAMMGKKSSLTFTFRNDPLEGISISDEDLTKYNDFVDGEVNEENVKAAKLFAEILLEACSHTGKPEEGDFLYLNFLSADCHYAEEDGKYTLTVSSIKYLMQESDIQTVRNASDEMFRSAGVDKNSASAYEKVKCIYDFLYDNVDFASNGTSSAAEALRSRASSTGYASLAYYLLNDAGVDARVITGNGRAWLISDIGGQYYYLDPASDANARDKNSYAYFLKGSDSFSTAANADWQYTSDLFKAGYPVSTADYKMSSMTLDRSEYRMTAGDTVTLSATSSSGNAIRYSSSAPDVASVSSSGLVTAHKAGEAVITATDGEGSATCTIHVTEEYELAVSVEDNVTTYVSGGGSYLEGDIVTITAINQTRDGYRFVEWQLPSGIQYLDGGTRQDYRLSFYMPGMDVEAVAVYEKVEPQTITLDETALTLNPGDRATLTWTVSPEGASTENISFRSSNTSVATVDSNGNITAVARGSATITMTAGSTSATCEVTVKGEEHVIQVVGRNSSGILTTQKKTVTSGESITISVPNVEKYGYRFTGWTPSVSVTYDSGYGSSDIRTSFVMPDRDVTMTANYEEITVDSISLDETSISLAAGRTYRLSSHIDIEPSNAIDADLTYKSSDETVAKVSSTGVITAVDAGTATITVSCGNASAELKVTVTGSGSTTSGTEYLNINVASLKMYAGRTYTLSVTKRNVGKVTFSSDNTSVATVDSNGVVTGVAAGTATITAVSESGKTRDTVNVTVVARTSDASTTSTSSSGSGLTEQQANVLKANAAKYKADADLIRADALRAGYVPDGTGNTSSSSGSNGSSASESASVTDVSADVSQEDGGSASRPTSSQPTGDQSNLPFWAALSGSLAAMLAALWKRLGLGKPSIIRHNRRGQDES